MTYHDYQDLPDAGPRYQLVEGELYMAAAPTTYHQRVAANLYYLLREQVEENPIGELLFAPTDVYLTDINVYQPDILFVTTAHLGVIEPEGLKGAPDFVVEILSPSSAKLDIGPKRQIYARTGTTELWIIDPVLKRISVYHFPEEMDNPVQIYNHPASFTSRTFPGLTLDTSRIFP